MKRFFAVSAAVLSIVLVVACNKDKFQTTPQISVKSYSSKEIPAGSGLNIKLEYTDKQGDVGGGEFYAARYRLNANPLSPFDDKADTLRYAIPNAPKKDKGELDLTLDYNFLKESTTENDTLVFKIAIKDVAGNMSDTITTSQLVIRL